MTAARLVKRARLDTGLSQRALAAAAGVLQSTIAQIKLGTLHPRSTTIERVLAAAGGRSSRVAESAGLPILGAR